MASIDLSQKTILMTGALGGIAKHIVLALLDAGANLALTDRMNETEATGMLASWQVDPARYSYRQLDVTDASAVTRVVEEGFRAFSQPRYSSGPRRRLRAAPVRHHVSS